MDGTCPAAPGGEGKEWSATLTVALDNGGGEEGGKGGGKGSTEGGSAGGGTETGGEGATGGTQSGGEGGKGGTEGGWSGADGGGDPCTEPHLGNTEPDKTGTGWAEGAPSGKGEHSGSHADCDGAAVDHGVQAGDGGTFTDSVPALVAGGVLIAGAAGGAVYRLRRKTPTAQD